MRGLFAVACLGEREDELGSDGVFVGLLLCFCLWLVWFAEARVN